MVPVTTGLVQLALFASRAGSRALPDGHPLARELGASIEAGRGASMRINISIDVDPDEIGLANEIIATLKCAASRPPSHGTAACLTELIAGT